MLYSFVKHPLARAGNNVLRCIGHELAPHLVFCKIQHIFLTVLESKSYKGTNDVNKSTFFLEYKLRNPFGCDFCACHYYLIREQKHTCLLNFCFFIKYINYFQASVISSQYFLVNLLWGCTVLLKSLNSGFSRGIFRSLVCSFLIIKHCACARKAMIIPWSCDQYYAGRDRQRKKWVPWSVLNSGDILD
jgi:hypothetical protein